MLPLGRPGGPARLGLIGAACLAGLAAASPAMADEAPNGSGVSQYVELVPGAAGPTAPSVTKEKRAPLPRPARQALARAPAPVAKALEQVATSSRWGSPTTTLKATPAGRRPVTVPTPDRSPAVGVAFRGAVGALGAGSDDRLLALLVVMGAMTVVSLMTAARQRRV